VRLLLVVSQERGYFESAVRAARGRPPPPPPPRAHVAGERRGPKTEKAAETPGLSEVGGGENAAVDMCSNKEIHAESHVLYTGLCHTTCWCLAPS
jgi:hypothetical protein